MTDDIISKLQGYIVSLRRHRELADCTAERATTYHVSHLDELIDVLYQAECEIERCRATGNQHQ